MIAAKLPRQVSGNITATTTMQTLETNTYTRLQLYWELCRYRQQFNGALMTDRTFRRWRQKLGIVPDELGLYWQSDLERLKDAVRRLSQGQSLDQIAQTQKENTHAYS